MGSIAGMADSFTKIPKQKQDCFFSENAAGVRKVKNQKIHWTLIIETKTTAPTRKRKRGRSDEQDEAVQA
jgi:hypothetical protein